MSVDIEKLEQLARSATPGPWRWENSDLVGPDESVDVYGDGSEFATRPKTIVITDSGFYPPHGADRDYLAAVSPDVILQLLADRRELVALVDARREAVARLDEVKSWMDEQGLLGNLVYNDQAPTWNAYVTAQHNWEMAMLELDKRLRADALAAKHEEKP